MNRRITLTCATYMLKEARILLTHQPINTLIKYCKPAIYLETEQSTLIIWEVWGNQYDPLIDQVLRYGDSFPEQVLILDEPIANGTRTALSNRYFYKYATYGKLLSEPKSNNTTYNPRNHAISY